MNRKEIRKAARKEKKKRKEDFYKMRKRKISEEGSNDTKQPTCPPKRTNIDTKALSTHTPENYILRSSDDVSNEVNHDDVAKYEKLLGISKTQMRNEFSEDGLDYLLQPFGDDSGSEESFHEESDSKFERIEHSAVSTKYVPPQRQNIDKSLKVRRQIQGLINRLTEANLEGIFKSMEQVFDQNPRRIVSDALVEVLLELFDSSANLLNTLIISYASLISLISAARGVETAVTLIEKVVSRMLKSATGNMNHILFICHLYNFKIVSKVFIFDFVAFLIEELDEVYLEYLIGILKNCGYQLRKDDPQMLKNVIQTVNEKTETIGKSFRFKFLIETLTEIKNNKRRQNPIDDLLTKLKKLISNLTKTHNYSSIEPLGFSLDDLMSVDKRGKWWQVGSVWKGEDREENEVEIDEANLLAKKQKMNTDVKKRIFNSLMKSEDYTDGFERLVKLNLRQKQEREIPKVLIHCCAQESSYNHFYTLVSQKFCEASYNHKITFQFCLWDFFKEIENKSKSTVRNIARMYAYLVQGNSLALTILKAAKFEDLNQPMLKFLQYFFLFLIEDISEVKIAKLFRRLNAIDKSEDVKNGIMFYVAQVLSEEKKVKENLERKEKLKIIVETLSSGRFDFL